MNVITTDKALSLLEKAVESKPTDYALSPEDGCRYSNMNGTPSCIVGTALHNMGLALPLSDFELDVDDRHLVNRAPVTSMGFLQWLDKRGYAVTDGALRVLKSAQDVQDDGYTWRSALEAAQQTAAVERSNPSHINKLVNPDTGVLV